MLRLGFLSFVSLWFSYYLSLTLVHRIYLCPILTGIFHYSFILRHPQNMLYHPVTVFYIRLQFYICIHLYIYSNSMCLLIVVPVTF